MRKAMRNQTQAHEAANTGRKLFMGFPAKKASGSLANLLSMHAGNIRVIPENSMIAGRKFSSVAMFLCVLPSVSTRKNHIRRGTKISTSAAADKVAPI